MVAKALAERFESMTRFDLINWFIKTFNYQSYLEIGLYRSSRCFDHVGCNRKWWIDPMPKAIPRDAGTVTTSDAYFAMPNIPVYDLVFIDGLHEADQVVRDVNNALHICGAHTVIIHDCWAPQKERSVYPDAIRSGPWYGTVWQAWCWLRENPDLYMRMFIEDNQCGMGIIQHGKQNPIDIHITEWEQFNAERKEIALPIMTEKGLEEVYVHR